MKEKCTSKVSRIIALMFVFLLPAVPVWAVDLSGTYDVGASQVLKNLNDVAAHLNGSNLTGHVVYELNADYAGGETFPVIFTSFTGTYTATIRLKGGAGAKTTEGSDPVNLIRFDGVANLIFDGREGGVGTSIVDNKWTISNTNTTGTTFTFVNDAKCNVLRYCNIQSVNASIDSGTILFSTASVAGNDTITIDHCAIYDGATNPLNAIYSAGSATYTNSGNVISNNHIYNFRNLATGTTTSSSGIVLESNSTGWTISDNSFYQTEAYEAASTLETTTYGVSIKDGISHVITGNFIGGSAPNCGGNPWTVNGEGVPLPAVPVKFRGISVDYLNTDVATAPSVQGNTISNIRWGTSSPVTISATSSGEFCGIEILKGSANVGTVEGNVIGSIDGTDDIVVTGVGGPAWITFIHTGSAGGSTVNIANNTIAGVTNVGATTSQGTFTYCIYLGSAAASNVVNNTIGNPAVANSISGGLPGTTAGSFMRGIMAASNGFATIQSNTLSNFTLRGTAASNVLHGIYLPGGNNIISENTITNFTMEAANTTDNGGASVIGIRVASSSGIYRIWQNTISNLSNTHSSAAVKVLGINSIATSTATSTIYRNSVSGLSVVSTNATAAVRGINFESGKADIQNNFIELGEGLTSGISITGINVTASTAGTGVYFNTVKIGGLGVAGSLDTYAFRCDEATNSRTVQNNIFYTDRSNASGTGKYYAVRIAGTSGLTIDYNDYYATGTGTVFGYNGADVADLAAWKTSTGQDVNSISVLPTDPALVAGLPIAGITTDFNGTTRAATPTIGAFELSPSAATWTGATSTDWNTPSNWSGSAVPSASTDVTISTGVPRFPVVNQVSGSPAVCAALTIEPGATLTIAPAKALTVNGLLTNSGTSSGLVIQSNATGTGSLIAGSVSGPGTAQRWMTAGAWHMAASSVPGQSIAEFLTANTNIATNSSYRGMIDYDPASNKWNGFFTNGTGGNLDISKGFAMRVESTSGTVTFSGLVQAGPISATGFTPGFWNCIGNPFTSAIGINSMSGSVEKFITANVIDAANIDPVYGAIYVWDQSDDSNEMSGKYTVVSNASAGFEVQQGQAFFVKMNTGASSVNFNTAMQLHNGTLNLKSAGVPWPTINLTTQAGSQLCETIITFNNNMTFGLDPTFDAGLFKGRSDLTVYSWLVEDIGVPFAIQALPNYSYSAMIIPIGVDFKSGGEVVFSAQLSNLPEECEVILEDKLNKIFTDLSKTSYTVLLEANSEITDRFKLHMSSLTTGSGSDQIPIPGSDISFGELKAYAVSNAEIQVAGEVGRNTIATLYDIQGRKIVIKILEEGNLNIIPTPYLRTGIYLLSVRDNEKMQRFKIPVKE
ncbi:T9SS type A sorting domain-containing protein [Gaoshiqia sp. Z1-71]|uniref:T9SS type A sorting domain-containing protein n=1 Tax=Gaoshiqia hydrogeniformans TaxID=3290090 RepID=UPI003BF88C1D